MIMTMFESSNVVDIFLKYDVSKTNDSSKYKLSELEGITNTSFIVEVDNKKFVLRIPGENPDVINRESEKHNTLLVQEQGLTLPFIVFDHESGIKISEYFDIYTYSKSDFQNSDKYFNDCLMLPINTVISDDEIKYVIDSIKSFYE